MNALAQLVRVTMARHVDEAGRVAHEVVDTGEQCDALVIQDVQDAEADLEKVVPADLEQLVARKGLQDMLQRLAVVT